MEQSPESRDAFIASMKAHGEGIDLEWHVIPTAVIDIWLFDCLKTRNRYEGFCLLYKPPNDVDPTSLLGKLKAIPREDIDGLSCKPPNRERIWFNIDDFIDLIETLQQRVADLEAIVAKLPVTADGVPVVPGMSVWYPSPYDGEIYECRNVLRPSATYFPKDGRCQVSTQFIGVSRCYSTREAAEAKEQP